MLSFTAGGSQISWGPVFDHTISYLRKKSAFSFLLNVSLLSSLTIGLWNSLKTETYPVVLPSGVSEEVRRENNTCETLKTCHTLIVRALCFFSHYECQRALTVSTDNAEMKIPQKTAEGFQCNLLWEKNIMVSILGPFVCIFVIQVVLKHFQRMKRVLTARGNSILCPAFETPRVPLK